MLFPHTMASDDGRGDEGGPEGAENGNHLLLQSLEKEVLSLRKSRDEQEETTASLLAELQRRCDKVIELEVNLDQERARADRLARERTEEEEALSGELRDIMATVTVGSDVSDTPAAAAAPASPAAGNDLPFDSESIERQQAANKTEVGREPGQEPPEDGGGGGGGSAIASASGVFSEWRLGRVRGGRASDDDRNGNNAVTGSGKPGPAGETMTTEEQENQKDSADGRRGDGQQGSSNGGGGAREQVAGALRARVVELELQRAEAADEMREKTDRSIRLEVQVEQLKNIVQSLSHASSREETQGWGQGSATTTRTQGMVDLDPLLRDVPGVDPSVLLLLHRTPWADVVLEGIRKQEACFEWQGKDSRGAWSSRLGTLPTGLSSLPLHHLAGPHPPPQPPPPPPPQSVSSLPQSTSSPSSSSPSSSRSRSPTLAQTGSVAADHARSEAGGQAGSDARAGGLRDKIGGAVAAVAAAGRGLGGGIGGAAGWRMVTDEGVTFRFELDDVELPSHHWEWVGGWMVDSETEASSDQDGWIYGRSPSEISEIALGQKSSYSNGMRSSSSSPEIRSSSSSAADATPGAACVGDGAREPEARPEHTQDGDETPPPQQQQRQQQQQRLVTGNYSDGDMASTANNKPKEDAKGPRRQATAATFGGGSDGAGGGWGLRRRRLVRLRMVRTVDGARDSTTSVLEMIRRLSSMEILVRKLSRQVVTQQRQQMTALESQVAFLAPLQPKLRMACALGRKDRTRGDALQGKLIEVR
ncbi:unnamed protein product [Ectocarpus sp. 8 AP-2014]